jgi:hypothetical protein
MHRIYFWKSNANVIHDLLPAYRAKLILGTGFNAVTREASQPPA